MKRFALLLALAAASLSACAAPPTLPAAQPGNASADAVDINDPTRPMFGGGIGTP